MRTKIILDAQELKKQYRNLKTIDKVASHFCVSKSTIKKLFKEYNITFSNTNKFKVNDYFFDQDSRESFYIAGFIAADGCVDDRDLCIRISSNDKNHLENLNSVIQSNDLLEAV